MNTKINYLYRDASNYKCYNEAVVAGEFKKEDIPVIESIMDHEYFIPEQVGLHLVRPDDNFTEDDHPYAEILDLDWDNALSLTDEEPTEENDLTWVQLVENFKKVGNTGWNDLDYIPDETWSPEDDLEEE